MPLGCAVLPTQPTPLTGTATSRQGKIDNDAIQTQPTPLTGTATFPSLRLQCRLGYRRSPHPSRGRQRSAILCHPLAVRWTQPTPLTGTATNHVRYIAQPVSICCAYLDQEKAGTFVPAFSLFLKFSNHKCLPIPPDSFLSDPSDSGMIMISKKIKAYAVSLR